jgi:tripartite-type tricarboxylate transporter receptor subunit TctC
MLRHLFTTCLFALLGSTAYAQAPQDYPSRPVRIVISFPPGGSTDFLARMLAERLQAVTMQTFLVENRPGGNAVIAADAVAKSPPDGYTLFMAVDAAMSLNPLLYSQLSYHPERDFAPISHIASQPLFIVASARSPAKTLPELLAYAKANPGKLQYGSSAMLQQLTGEKIKQDAGIDMVHVPFKGSPPMLQALLAGDIDFAITSTMPYANYVKDGKLFGIVTSGTKREVLLPTTPIVSEVGMNSLEFGNWNGLYAPAGTPKPVIDKLNADVRRAWADQAVNERLSAVGIYPSASTPEELRSLLRSDVERWAKVIKAAGIKLN